MFGLIQLHTARPPQTKIYKYKLLLDVGMKSNEVVSMENIHNIVTLKEKNYLGDSQSNRDSLDEPPPRSSNQGSGKDPCLRVVQRCGHVTPGEGMPTWTRGKDGILGCTDNNTTEEKVGTIQLLDRVASVAEPPLTTHGRSS